MTPRFFKSPTELRSWLDRHHDKTAEVWVGFYKKDSGKKGITYAEALDEALSYGWIDGVRKSLDHSTWTIRFTPRKRRSHWSAVNIKRLGELKAEGRVRPAGLQAFEARDRTARQYSYEAKPQRLDPAYETRFKANKRAWDFWQTQPQSYRRAAIHWVTSAKRPETRERRLQTLIEDSAAGCTVKPLTPPASR